MARRFRPDSLLLLLLAFPWFACAEEDHRAWQHGIDLLRVEGRLLAIWGSAGNPPQKSATRNWQHDIYYSWVGADSWVGTAGAQPEPRILVSRPEAQEPPSAAINSIGTILVTSEDGEGRINQRAGLWDSSLRVLRKYPFTIRRGGHSGHAAAMGERFLVVYGEGWVKGGGWNDLGTGSDLYARIVENEGTRRKEVSISKGQRDSWPLVAGSNRNWLMVWQRYPGMTLHSALIDASGNVVKRGQVIDGLPLRYSYGVEYSAELAAYVVAGTSSGQGFVALIGMNGEVRKLQTGLPPMASESRIVLGKDGMQPIAVYPASPRGVAVVNLSMEAITLGKLVEHPHVWDYTGTAGAFIAPGRVLFATLTTGGLRLFDSEILP